MLGICKLCNVSQELVSGHILPKHLYGFINADNKGFYSYDGTLREKGLLQVTTRQFKKYLFCKPCEDLLCDKETHVPKYLRYVNSTEKKDRTWFLAKIPLNYEVEQSKEFIKNDMTEEKVEILNYFDKKKLDIIKFYSLSIIFRQFYFDEKTNLTEDMVEKIKRYILGKEEINVQMHVLINTNESDFSLVSMPYNFYSDQYFHSSLCLQNIFVYLHYRSDNSICEDEYVVLSDDFYNLHESSKPLKSSLDYFRKFVKNAEFSKKAEELVKKNGLFVFDE